MKFFSPLTHFSRVYFCLALLLGIFQLNGFAQQESSMWDSKAENTIESRGKRLITPEKYLVYGLDRSAINQVLADAPMEFTIAARLKQTILEIPDANGILKRFRVEESPILSPELAAQHPDWKSYQGYGIDDPTATARFDVTMDRFYAYVLSNDGTFAIDPYQQNDLGNYIVYAKKDLTDAEPMHCEFGVGGETTKISVNPEVETSDFSNGTQIRTYRLAMATTGEYTSVFRQAGDTDAQAQTRGLAAVNVTVSRVTGVYRRDLAISFVLVSGTNLVYPNAATDPWINTSGDLDNITTVINGVIGSGAYDIGHLVQTSDGGVAGLGVVCGSTKGRGLTGRPNPSGDSFDIDYVAHEMGHQFNQNHTFNAATNCGSSPTAARVEPGSGVTIMGYAGICESTANLARNSIDVFHVYNLTETVGFITSGAGASCGTTSGNNVVPVISALANYSIPFNTPFALTASATDTDGDALTYNWEMNTAGASGSNYPTTTDDDDAGGAARPLFRSYVPSTNPTRMFPSLPYILNNSNEAPITYTGTSVMGAVCAGTCITGEDLPSIARAMQFRVTVRDGRGGNVDAPVTVTTVNTTTPFRVTTQNTATNWTGNTSQTVTWNVSGTTAAPISTANVRILLSTDGGQTFPTVLAASTANDGSESITVPNSPTTQARIKVEAVGNIFFDINDVNFTIAAAAAAPVITPGTISIVSESCGIGNNNPDPGETLTVSLPLSNTGTVNTTNLVATLQATGGVTAASSQTYGVLVAGGAAVTRNFTFTVNSGLACGSPVTLTFTLADGATVYPSVTQNYSTGAAGAIFAQNFDGVTAPALPAGWTNVQTVGTGISWRTSTTTPNSTPNAAFANGASSTNTAALLSPAVAINSATAQIRFKNRYTLENTYDGTVLEFSTNGGTTWTDIISGGGSFVSGGYNVTMQAGSSIGGRQAWSGNSGAYIDTVVNLPASFNGQSVRFRWLTASDSSVIATGTPGQWIDDVQVIGTVCQFCTTAANVSVGGRVLLPNNSGVAKATVTLTDSNGVSRSTVTSTFGTFSFEDVEAGGTYVLRVSSKRYAFAPQVVSPSDDVTDIRIISESE